MQMDRRFCSICAWRDKCQKRFIERGNKSDLHCIDYTRDVTIKDFDKTHGGLPAGKMEGRRFQKRTTGNNNFQAGGQRRQRDSENPRQ